MNRHGSFGTRLDARNLIVILVGLVMLAVAWDYAAVLLAVAILSVVVNVVRFALAKQRSRR